MISDAYLTMSSEGIFNYVVRSHIKLIEAEGQLFKGVLLSNPATVLRPVTNLYKSLQNKITPFLKGH